MPKLYSKICDRSECKRPFQTHHNSQLFCSRTCAAYVRREKHGFPAWREAEIKLVEQLSGQCPFPEIVRRLHFLAVRRGWQPRTEAAIRSFMSLQGYTRKCSFDNFTAAELARILGVLPNTVHNWRRHGGLPCQRVYKTQLAIKLKDFKRWAAQNPHYLARVEHDRLMWLLEDAALVNLICNTKPSPLGKPIPVKRVDTGEIYPSQKQAAIKNYLDKTTLSKAMQGKRFVAGGIEWEVV